MTASAQPSKGWRSRVIITESGKSRRWVVCRPFFHHYSAWSADAMPDPPHRRRTPSPRPQGLVDSTGRGAGRTTRDTDSNGPEDEERDGESLLPAFSAGLAQPRA